MITDDKRCVIDTNILIYSTVQGNPWHDQMRAYLKTLQDDGIQLYITSQIVREYLVILTRGDIFEATFSVEQSLNTLNNLLLSFKILRETDQTHPILLNLIRNYKVKGKQIHDANIVAVMITHGISRLATCNHDDFKRYNEISLEALEC